MFLIIRYVWFANFKYIFKRKIFKLRKNSSFNWFTPFHVLIRPDVIWKKISRPLYHIHFTVIHTNSRHNIQYRSITFPEICRIAGNKLGPITARTTKHAIAYDNWSTEIRLTRYLYSDNWFGGTFVCSRYDICCPFLSAMCCVQYIDILDPVIKRFNYMTCLCSFSWPAWNEKRFNHTMCIISQ